MMIEWQHLPLLKHYVEWRWAQQYLYPNGQVPWGALLRRTLVWYWLRWSRQLAHPRIIRIQYHPEIELLVPSLTHEYPLFVYHTPLYEAEFFVLPALLKPNMTALNIGAHIGIYTLALAQLLPNGHVYAFEPALETYRQLQVNILWNQMRKLVPLNINTYRLALGDSDGETILFHAASSMQASLFTTYLGQSYEQVPVMRLNSWLATQRISQIDLIIIDVEGAEDIVLQHGTDLLRHYQPVILCEFNRKFGRQVTIWNLLSQFGYRFWRYHTRRNCIEPVTDPYDPAIYVHQTYHTGRGYGNVIAAPAKWTPPYLAPMSLSKVGRS